mmetsp:Transcript_18170/g.27274  ORF Transcript_18170/g.27274 Transcript_18170/m.27274 type:complete len:284 (+) Transcript_18170:85-936(+)
MTFALRLIILSTVLLKFDASEMTSKASLPIPHHHKALKPIVKSSNDKPRFESPFEFSQKIDRRIDELAVQYGESYRNKRKNSEFSFKSTREDLASGKMNKSQELNKNKKQSHEKFSNIVMRDKQEGGMTKADIFAKRLDRNIQWMTNHSHPKYNETRAIAKTETKERKAADPSRHGFPEIGDYAQRIEESAIGIQDAQLDELEKEAEKRWTDGSETKKIEKPRFATHKKGGPEWYQNPGPWWLPVAAEDPAEIKWVEKYKHFKNPPPGVLPVYLPFARIGHIG